MWYFTLDLLGQAGESSDNSHLKKWAELEDATIERQPGVKTKLTDMCMHHSHYCPLPI